MATITVNRTMSSGQLSRHRSISSASKRSERSRHTPPPSTLTPENTDHTFEPCAATGSFFLYAQRNTILVLHHDTLSIERRFESHREDVRWIVADNVSERGAGRVAVSYDTGHTAIVWDILTGREVTRFAAYDPINIATFMRNGNIAFGEPPILSVHGLSLETDPWYRQCSGFHYSLRASDERTSVRANDFRSSDSSCAGNRLQDICNWVSSIALFIFACLSANITSYLNGSILIATLQPAFTILHTLTTSRAPSRITGLAWHGSSSKQRTEMLATQTADGDLRVWSVPKGPGQDAPTIIRALGRSEMPQPGPCWFAWSKNGRLVQYYNG